MLQAEQVHTEVTSVATTVTAQPEWFDLFLADRETRKPSPHTVKAYWQDFEAIAAVLAEDAETMAGPPVSALTKDAMRIAFATYGLFDFDRAISMKSGFAQVTRAGCSGSVVGSHRARRGLSTQ
jgi:hypothetical protein